MTSPSSSVQEARRALGKRLSEIRLEAGLTKRALANSLGWHESKCSRFESGTRPPSERDPRAWAAACGAASVAEDLVSTARGIEGMYVEWRRMERTGLKQAQESVLPLWERTQRFRIYSPWLIPGPVQTASYITALLTSIRNRRGLIDDVPAAAKVRVEKQQIVYGFDVSGIRNVETNWIAAIPAAMTVEHAHSAPPRIFRIGTDRAAQDRTPSTRPSSKPCP